MINDKNIIITAKNQTGDIVIYNPDEEEPNFIVTESIGNSDIEAINGRIVITSNYIKNQSNEFNINITYAQDKGVIVPFKKKKKG